jgi:hypothetical protein
MANRILAWESILSLAHETSVSEQTPHRWKHQALINVGLIDGVDSDECAQLREANERIKALEKELPLVKDASDLFDARAVVPQETVGNCRRTSGARLFNPFCHPGIWGEQVNSWLPDTTQTAG